MYFLGISKEKFYGKICFEIRDLGDFNPPKSQNFLILSVLIFKTEDEFRGIL